MVTWCFIKQQALANTNAIIPIACGYSISCCVEGDWFIYHNDRMLFNTVTKGFDSFELAVEALLEVCQNAI